jgi:hypothetical protein
MIELLLCGAIALYLVTRRDLRELAVQLGPGHRALLGGLVVLLFVGHLAGRGKHSFPFVPWDMYGERAQGDPIFHRFALVRASGRQDPITGYGPGRHLPTQLHQRLQSLAIEDAASSGDAARAALEETLRAVARVHADDVPDDPPVAIEIWRSTIPLHDAAHPTDVRVEHLRRIELP